MDNFPIKNNFMGLPFYALLLFVTIILLLR
jgi:hypothetical protein